MKKWKVLVGQSDSLQAMTYVAHQAPLSMVLSREEY